MESSADRNESQSESESQSQSETAATTTSADTTTTSATSQQPSTPTKSRLAAIRPQPIATNSSSPQGGGSGAGAGTGAGTGAGASPLPKRPLVFLTSGMSRVGYATVSRLMKTPEAFNVRAGALATPHPPGGGGGGGGLASPRHPPSPRRQSSDAVTSMSSGSSLLHTRPTTTTAAAAAAGSLAEGGSVAEEPNNSLGIPGQQRSSTTSPGTPRRASSDVSNLNPAQVAAMEARRAKRSASFNQFTSSLGIAEGSSEMDLALLDSAETSMRGADYLFIIPPAGPNALEKVLNYLVAAKSLETAIRHIVLLSVTGAELGAGPAAAAAAAASSGPIDNATAAQLAASLSPVSSGPQPVAPGTLPTTGPPPASWVPFARLFLMMEKSVAESGIPYTIIRCPMFQETLHAWTKYLHNEVFPLPLNSSSFCPISVHDVAKAVSVIFSAPHKHENMIYTLTGHKAYSGADAAKSAAKVLQQKVNHVNQQLSVTRKFLGEFYFDASAPTVGAPGLASATGAMGSSSSISSTGSSASTSTMGGGRKAHHSDPATIPWRVDFTLAMFELYASGIGVAGQLNTHEFAKLCGREAASLSDYFRENVELFATDPVKARKSVSGSVKGFLRSSFSTSSNSLTPPSMLAKSKSFNKRTEEISALTDGGPRSPLAIGESTGARSLSRSASGEMTRSMRKSASGEIRSPPTPTQTAAPAVFSTAAAASSPKAPADRNSFLAGSAV
ncbi:hypothetical protein CAOG_06279 [Capsaspora owczarzaki ATCC 30864]|uniref:Uncharacterized protein n=1 Tax=Capsaspora owczarzaki (strain ATCC 30864) TaxID=595528 RepID=A0A0D2ULA1_CAPO3|nr:hypothetical protein CAOG_06279 [Capsaspora owczarzaki ATCC 30864]KJE95876.1 hypothetical protein CAOG_006279 [Capsaspora owczarzaki ATCC 30864]|eukprot:XP_004345028.1 hypothetical protein CAOG_06279 [Capsaspora owczarzaki ATCC 30864]